jgi:hypothetical protein
MRLKNHLTNTKQNWVNHRIETHWRTPVSSMSPRYVQIYYSDWLIGELFSYTELKKNLILTAAALSSKYWHGMAPHKSSPGTFPGKTSPKLWSLSCLLFFSNYKNPYFSDPELHTPKNELSFCCFWKWKIYYLLSAAWRFLLPKRLYTVQGNNMNSAAMLPGLL